MTMLCSICVPTYKRPEHLRRLLQSILNQIPPEEVALDVVVVDNDADASAKTVVEECASNRQTSISYWLQPVRNISLTRNVALEKARGTYVLFIDDDEFAPPHWIRTLLKALKEYDADGVFGPVIPDFRQDIPEWFRRCYMYVKNTSAGPTGTSAESKWSGNCVLKTSLLREVNGPFDLRYGLTGGEDTHLFDRLERRGARFVYCKEAFVYEYISPDMTCVSYLVKRAFTGGNTYTRRMIELSNRNSLCVRLAMLGKGLGFVGISFFLIFLTLPSRFARTYWMLTLAANAGRLLSVLEWHYQAYK